MRSCPLFALLCFFQYILLAHAAGGSRAGDIGVKDPTSQESNPQPPQDESNPVKANAPGAIAQGSQPEVAPSDSEIDIEKVGEKLKDLIEKIASLVDDVTSTSTSTDGSGSTYITTMTIATSKPLPSLAEDCTSAQNAYRTCSSANTNFSGLPATQQAGCLCNASPNIDFNRNMKNCYSYATNQTQYMSYATAVANATSLCAPSSLPSGCATAGNVIDEIACSENPPAPAAAASASAPATSTPTPSSSGAESWVRFDGVCYFFPTAVGFSVLTALL